jgi:hypothetical protein
MKRLILLFIPFTFAYFSFAQTKMSIKEISGAASSPTIIASEEWGAIMDNDSADHGQQTFNKYSDGSFLTNGTWYYDYNGATVECPFSGGTAVFIDTVMTFSAQGTATNPAARVGYQTSPFVLTVAGIVHNGRSYGTWVNAFTTTGWPSTLQGTFTATKLNGSGVTVSVKGMAGKNVPQAFTLLQNYPNPFNPSTTIAFSLPSQSFVSLKVFDVLGREVATIVSEEMAAGTYSRRWNATKLSSGIYFYRLQAGSNTQMKKLILLK